MKYKIADLEGQLLDAAVAKAEGRVDGPIWQTAVALGSVDPYRPSTDWQYGGPIIESERILLSPLPEDWRAVHTPSGYLPPHDTDIELEGGEYLQESSPRVAAHGSTPLVAAMRAYIRSRFGEFIDLP